MTKRMLSLVLVLAMVLTLFAGLTLNAHADGSIDFTSNYSADTDLNGVTVDGGDFTVTFAKGTGSTNPKYYANGTAVRFYGGNTMTITAKNSATMNKIELSLVSGNAPSGNSSADVGTWTESTGTWTGSSNEVVISNTATKGNWRFTAIAVTIATAGGDCDHADAELTAAVPSTCTVAGTSAYWYCPDCDKYFADNNGTIGSVISTAGTALPLAEHSWDEVDNVASTCTVAGHIDYECTVCHTEKTENLPLAAHNYVNGVCSVCGAAEPSGYELTATLEDGEYVFGVVKGTVGTDTAIGAVKGELSGTWGAYTVLTPENGLIASADDIEIWTLENVTGGITLQNKSTGKYLSLPTGTGSGSGVPSFSDDPVTIYTSVVSADNSTFKLHPTDTSTNQLACNFGSGYGYRMYNTRTQGIDTGICVEIRFYKAGSSTPACDHADAEFTAEVPSTCSEAGHAAYWYCSDCQHYFTDNNGAIGTQTTLQALAIAATGVHTDANNDNVCDDCHETIYAVATDINNGDSVVIYNPNAKLALTGAAITSGSYHYLTGAAPATVSDTQLTVGTSDALVLKATVSGSTIYLQDEDDNYLTSTGNNQLTLESTKNDTGSAWTLTVQDATNNLVLLTSGAARMEYYNTAAAFTTYGTTGTGAAYQMRIYTVADTNAHQHTPDGNGYYYDENNHWYVCSDPSCTEQDGIYAVEAHTLTNDGDPYESGGHYWQDKECVCGYTTSEDLGATFTVTYIDNFGSLSGTETGYGTYTLKAGANTGDYTFLGWVVDAIGYGTTTEPTELVTTTDAAITVRAAYSYNVGGNAGWTVSSSAPEIGDTVIIATAVGSGYYALPNSYTSGTATVEGVELDVTDDTSTDGAKWSVTSTYGDNDGLYLYNGTAHVGLASGKMNLYTTNNANSILDFIAVGDGTFTLQNRADNGSNKQFLEWDGENFYCAKNANADANKKAILTIFKYTEGTLNYTTEAETPATRNIPVGFQLAANADIGVTLTFSDVASGDKIYLDGTEITLREGKYTFSVAAKDIDVTHKLTAKDASGNALTVGNEAEKSFNARSYIGAQEGNTTVETGKTASVADVVKTMANYGEAAKKYFTERDGGAYTAVKTYDIAFNDSTGELSTAAGAASTKSGNFYGASLLLEDQIKIRFYFTVASAVADKAEFVVTGGTAADKGVKGNYVYVDVPVDAPYLNTEVSVTLTYDSAEAGSVIDYTALRYMGKVIAKEGTANANDNLIALCKALFMYYKAANGYFG